MINEYNPDTNSIHTDPSQSMWEKIKFRLVDNGLYILIGIVILFYAVKSPVFLSYSNIKELLANASPLLIVATGITFVILLAEIDLSVGSVAGLSAAVWLVAIKAGIPLIIATVMGLLVGVLIGLINACLIVILHVNSFLVTLGMQILIRGVIFIVCGGSQIIVPDSVRIIVGTQIFAGISPLIFISFFLVILMQIVYKYLPFGRYVQAVGGNYSAAQKVGINVRKVKVISFVMCGVFAGLGGMAQVANVGILNAANVGIGYEFLAITAVVLGGTSLFGGVGKFVPGTLIGVVFLMSIENGLGILGANPYLYPIVRGLIIYLAMLSDSFKSGLSMKRKLM
ncbi:MAG: ABC transporter permease [Eubacteriales bacterium]